MPDGRDLLALHIEALFTHDAAGRMLRVNEPGGGPAPRFFLGRTRAGNLWRARHDLPAPLVARLDAIAATEPVTAGLDTPPAGLSALRAALTEHAPIQEEGGGPAFYFPDAITPPDVVPITDASAELVRNTFPWLIPFHPAWRPCVAVVQGGAAVSICHSSRLTPRAAEAGVETLPDYRGRGYATRVTAGWALAVRALGLTPLYSTSWDNLASQGVARSLGLIMYANDLNFV